MIIYYEIVQNGQKGSITTVMDTLAQSKPDTNFTYNTILISSSISS